MVCSTVFTIKKHFYLNILTIETTIVGVKFFRIDSRKMDCLPQELPFWMEITSILCSKKSLIRKRSPILILLWTMGPFVVFFSCFWKQMQKCRPIKYVENTVDVLLIWFISLNHTHNNITQIFRKDIYKDILVLFWARRPILDITQNSNGKLQENVQMQKCRPFKTVILSVDKK